MASSTLRLPTISKEGVKHILLAWLAVRVLSSGFFGRAVTAAAAGALAFGARQMPGLVPGAWRGGGGGGVARHAGGGAGAPDSGRMPARAASEWVYLGHASHCGGLRTPPPGRRPANGAPTR